MSTIKEILNGIPNDIFPKLVPPHSIVTTLRGSLAHGTHIPPESDGVDDIDLMSVYLADTDFYLGLPTEIRGQDIKIGAWDAANYEFRHFCKLLANGNPNVISMLWTDPKFLTANWLGLRLLNNRELFLTKRLGKSFGGYASGQLHRMTSFHEPVSSCGCEGEFHAEDCSEAKELGRGSSKRYATGFMGAKRKELVQKHGYDCYLEEETEFLTESGWRRFDEVGGLALGTVKIFTGEIEFQTPLNRTDKVHDGKMYVFEPHSSRAVVTPGHNMLVSDTHRKPSNGYSTMYDPSVANWRLESAEGIVTGDRTVYHVRRAPAERTQENHDVSDEYLALAGLYLSEGSTNYRENGDFKSIRFTQKKHGPFFQAADDLMGVFPLRRYAYEKETVWVLHGDTASAINFDFGHMKGKRLPNWCMSLSARQVEILWSHMMYGDGTNREHNQTLYTSVKKLADDIHAMLISSGIPSTVYGPYEFETSYGKCSMYHVMRSKVTDSFQSLYVKKLLPLGTSPIHRKQGFTVKEIDGTGKRVVCFEVRNGTLITRNNGRVAIHGNCKNAAHAIRLLTMAVEIFRDGKVVVDRTSRDAGYLKSVKRGERSLAEVQEMATGLNTTLSSLVAGSTLPDEVDRKAVNHLMSGILKIHLDTPRNSDGT